MCLLKLSGAAWRAHLAQTLHDLSYKSSYADPDIWYRAVTKADDINYYDYVLVDVDDILAISHQPAEMMNALYKLYQMKDGSVGPST